MTDEELREATNEMWADIEDDGEVLIDACGQKLGMPRAAPYIVAIPFCADGDTHIIEISPETATRLAHGLIAAAATARMLTAAAEAEYNAHTAISKAQDRAKEQ